MVLLKVLGKVVDAVRKKRDLNLRAARVSLVRCELGDYFRLNARLGRKKKRSICNNE